MSSGKLSNRYYAKSAKGLWVRAVEGGGSVVVSWHERHGIEDGGSVVRLGPDGEVLRRTPFERPQYPQSPWNEIGRIGLDRSELFELVPYISLFPELVRGLMKHVVEMVALGFGDDPVQVVEAFCEPELGTFVVPDCRYFIQRGIGHFGSLEGSDLCSASYEDGRLLGTVVLETQEGFPVDLEGKIVIGDLLRATVPVRR